jgi:hypothetical protein
MSDILSSGNDREPRWRPPRWLGGVAVGLAVVVAVAVALIVHRAAPKGAGAVPPAAGARTPARMTGQPLSSAARLWLLLGGNAPARLSLPARRVEPISGLPPDGRGYQLIRLTSGWAALPFPAGAGCGSCAPQPLPVYYLPDGARAARRIGTADFAAPAAAPGALWLVSYPDGADMEAASGTAQEVSTTGAALGARLRLPAGYAIDQGTRSGLLLVPQQAGPGSVSYELWDPRTGRVTRSLVNVIAAGPAEIAWMPGSRRVHMLGLPGGHVRELSLPAGSTVYQGMFSPDGRLLALLTATRATAAGHAAATRLMVATLASGRLAEVPGTMVGSANGVSFGWQAGSDRLIADVAVDTRGLPEWQIAVWQPGAARLSTVVARSPYDTWPVINQGPY